MARTADYTIQGFLYQFNKSLKLVLDSLYVEQIRVEGVVEDIDVIRGDCTEAIQCKYHESAANFALSAIYKPLLQMMVAFNSAPDAEIRYVLYAYFPDLEGETEREITKEELKAALATENEAYKKKYVANIKDDIDLDAFLSHFKFEPGITLEALEAASKKSLVDNGLPEGEIETLIYPNAIHFIAKKSIRHHADERILTKADLIAFLRTTRNTAITKWTMSLKSARQILNERKKQLKQNLSKNSRLRAFVLAEGTIEDFSNGIVRFIKDYVNKYHFKPAHDQTPIFYIDCSNEVFQDTCQRLHQQGVKYTDGTRGNQFVADYFLRKPVVKVKGRRINRDIDIRILKHSDCPDILSRTRIDDVFICAPESSVYNDVQDSNVEYIEVDTFNKIKFVIGVTDEY